MSAQPTRQTRSQSKKAWEPVPPEPKSKKPTKAQTAAKQSAQEKNAYARAEATKKWIEERSKIIEEYQYAYTDVYQALRDAKESLTKTEFEWLNYYMEEFIGAVKARHNRYECSGNTMISAEPKYLRAFYEFKKIFDTITTGETACRLCFPGTEDSNSYLIIANWEYLYETTEDCVTTHGDFLYVPPWINFPIEDITY